MHEIYLKATISINGQEILFTSDRLYIPRGCHKCGKYKEMPYGNQGFYLDYSSGRFLCDDCYLETVPGEPTSKITHFGTITADLRDKYILETINLDG